MSKHKVLAKMDSLRVDSLPVVGETGNIIGTVERSQLTASLILEVAARLEGKSSAKD